MSNERTTVLEARGLGKRYGKRWALRGVDLTIRAGEVVGFIGPNGAGKTTLIKLICGLSHVTAGYVRVLGEELAGRDVAPEGIGLVSEQSGFIPYLSGRKNLELLAGIRNVIGEREITASLQTVGLDPHDRRPVRAYSLGMRQRLALAQAIMEEPKLLLLDEPTNGLDPAGIIELRGLIRRLAEGGVAIFMASHLLTEVEHVCERVLLVREGRVVKQIDRREAEAPALRVLVSAQSHLAPLLEWARCTGVAVEPGSGALEVHLITDRPAPRVISELEATGVSIEEIGRVRRSLEQEFMDLIGAKGTGEAEGRA